MEYETTNWTVNTVQTISTTANGWIPNSQDPLCYGFTALPNCRQTRTASFYQYGMMEMGQENVLWDGDGHGDNLFYRVILCHRQQHLSWYPGISGQIGWLIGLKLPVLRTTYKYKFYKNKTEENMPDDDCSLILYNARQHAPSEVWWMPIRCGVARTWQCITYCATATGD